LFFRNTKCVSSLDNFGYGARWIIFKKLQLAFVEHLGEIRCKRTPGTGNVPASNSQDYLSIVDATTWNGLHTMVVPNGNYAIPVQKTIFLSADPRFVNNLSITVAGASTSADVQLSLRDSAATSGDFQNAAAGTIPVSLVARGL